MKRFLKMKPIYSILLPLFMVAAAIIAPPTVKAQADEGAIKQRMIERLDEVDAMKISGVVGENNRGFLEQRGVLNPVQTKVMNDENADRKALYEILAKRLGLSVTVVGQGRAESIRNKSAPNVWIQEPSGRWVQK